MLSYFLTDTLRGAATVDYLMSYTNTVGAGFVGACVSPHKIGTFASFEANYMYLSLLR